MIADSTADCKCNHLSRIWYDVAAHRRVVAIPYEGDMIRVVVGGLLLVYSGLDLLRGCSLAISKEPPPDPADMFSQFMCSGYVAGMND